MAESLNFINFNSDFLTNRTIFVTATMLIEASKGGHIGVVQLLLDYPNWMYQQQQPQEVSTIYNKYNGAFGKFKAFQHTEILLK